MHTKMKANRNGRHRCLSSSTGFAPSRPPFSHSDRALTRSIAWFINLKARHGVSSTVDASRSTPARSVRALAEAEVVIGCEVGRWAAGRHGPL